MTTYSIDDLSRRDILKMSAVVGVASVVSTRFAFAQMPAQRTPDAGRSTPSGASPLSPSKVSLAASLAAVPSDMEEYRARVVVPPETADWLLGVCVVALRIVSTVFLGIALAEAFRLTYNTELLAVPGIFVGQPIIVGGIFISAYAILLNTGELASVACATWLR